MKNLLQLPARLFVAAALVFAVVFSFSFAPSVAYADRPRISADVQSFDIGKGIYHLAGHVCVEIGPRIITADEAEVDLFKQIVTAKGHIELESETDNIKFSGDELKVVGDQKTAWVTGHVLFKQGGIIIMSDNASYCWNSKIAVFENRIKLLDANEKKKTKHEYIKYNVIKKEIIEKR